MAMVDNRPGSAGKLGILFYTLLDKCVEMDIYLADLDKFSCKGGGIVKEYPPIHDDPALRFQAPIPEISYPALCVHNSTLYMFDGYNPKLKPWIPPPRPVKTKAAYKSSATLLDLVKEREKSKESKVFISPQWDILKEESSATLFDLEKEERQQLVKMSSMNHAKGLPEALPTPDGQKILVFSTCFIFARSNEAFELYDPREGSFVTLPPLPLPHTDPECGCRICTITRDYDPDANDGYDFDYDRLDDFDEFVVFERHDVEKVVSYCFIGDSHFLLEMDFQTYTLDLRYSAWAKIPRGRFPVHNAHQGFYDTHRGYFETFMSRYALIPEVKPVSKYYRPDLQAAHVDQEVTLYVHDVGPRGFLTPSDEVIDRGGFFRPIYDKFLISSMVLPRQHSWDCGTYILPAPALAAGIQKNGESESVCSCNTYVVQQSMKDCGEEFRLLIDVCRSDFTTTHLKTTISKCASLSICSSERDGFPVCFTL